MDISQRLRAFIRSLPQSNLSQSRSFRLLRVAALLVGVVVAGTLTYYALCKGQYDMLTCAYMTVITVTAVGYGEIIPVSGHPDRIVLTMTLAILGMGIMLYFVSTLAAFIVDGELRTLLQGNRMKRKLQQIKGHYIVAGLGSLGIHVLEELQKSKQRCVVIEFDEDAVEDLKGGNILYVIGDATEDAVLHMANIEHAAGLIIALGNERDNLFTTISARGLNSGMRIITRGEDPSSRQKFERAGANSVIYTNVLGGLRMASEVLRPHVTSFLDLMLRDSGHVRRIEQISIPTDSPLVGKPLRETTFRQHTDALIVAVHETEKYVFNPGPDHVLRADSKIIVLTLVDDIPTLEAIVAGSHE